LDASTGFASVTVFGSTVISASRVCTSGVIDSWKRPSRCLERNFSIAAYIAMLFTGRAKPCPSSGATRYSTGKLRSRSATTIWSDSAFFTRGSLAPWITRSGVLMFFAENSGDCRSSCFRPSDVVGSPMRMWNILRPASQYGGMDSSRVCRLDGPTMETAAA
jgi:hypothetical protein